ncbi:MAG TPA: hypothetical protein DEB46_10465 [Myxococcales bacterium]|nr:hypothetical protein [Myxococcales bacterium]
MSRIRVRLSLGFLLIACTTPQETSEGTDGGILVLDAHGGPRGGGLSLPGNPQLESQIPEQFVHVYRIGGFYIMGTDERPLETDRQDRTGEEAVQQAVDLFSSLLDGDDDGDVDDPVLLENLAKHFVFAVGHESSLSPFEDDFDRRTGRYVMAMKTDVWPFFPDWNGRGFSLLRIGSSLWRPPNMNALWEECFHTVTEAYNRHRPEWSFSPEGVFGRSMQADIEAQAYDIEEQNRLEGGHYDWSTAVNEYIHQIWLVNQGGQAAVLTAPQIGVLDVMKATPGFPMSMDKDAERSLAVRVR